MEQYNLSTEANSVDTRQERALKQRDAVIACLKSDSARTKVIWMTMLGAMGPYFVRKALNLKSYPAHAIFGGILGWMFAKGHNVHVCMLQTFENYKNTNNTFRQPEEESFADSGFFEPMEPENTYVDELLDDTPSKPEIRHTTTYAELRKKHRQNEYSQSDVTKVMDMGKKAIPEICKQEKEVLISGGTDELIHQTADKQTID